MVRERRLHDGMPAGDQLGHVGFGKPAAPMPALAPVVSTVPTPSAIGPPCGVFVKVIEPALSSRRDGPPIAQVQRSQQFTPSRIAEPAEEAMYDLDAFRVFGPALPPAWLRYRDAFAVLQYLCTLGAREVGVGVPWQKVVNELGFSERQGEELLSYVLTTKCAEYHQGLREAALTQKALEYLESERGRRRSVRPPLAAAHAAGA